MKSLLYGLLGVCLLVTSMAWGVALGALAGVWVLCVAGAVMSWRSER